MFDQLFISVCSRLFIFWSLVCHYSTAFRNSWVRKSGIDFLEPLIYSMSKSKTVKIACHLAKICFEAMFSTSFTITYLALLQSICNKNFWFNKSLWNLEIHSRNGTTINLCRILDSRMEANYMFRWVWENKLFQNTSISNVRGISFNNFKGADSRNAKPR